MFDVCPLIRPVIQDEDPNREHAVWFLLDEVNGTYDAKSGIAKSKHWLKAHLEIMNVDNELVVPIMVSRDEYNDYFSPEAKEKPEEGLDAFLMQRYEKQRPEAKTFGEAKKSTIQLRATYHPVAHGVSTQKYLPQEGQGNERM